MSTALIDIEIEDARNKLAALEKQKQAEVEKELEKLESPLKVLQEIIDAKRKQIENSRYSKSIPLARFYDQEKLAMLEPIFNMLKSIDDRLKALEPKI
jgi:hypothetical protein